jgi:uncharacterized protein (TIGR03437 family)
MATYCDDTSTRKLVRWNVVFLKRGLEAVLPRPEGPRSGADGDGDDLEYEELVSGSTSQEEFRNAKLVQLSSNLARVRRPPLWVARNYPPGVTGPYVEYLPPGDGKYLQVYSRVLSSYEEPTVDWCEEQVTAIEKIAHELRGGGSPHHRVRLPASRMLAGSLNDAHSEFGDEFINFPTFLGEQPAAGHTMLTGWVEVRFDEPDGDLARFELRYFGVGTPVKIVWGGGQIFLFERTRTFPMPFLPDFTPVVNQGVLNLATGEVVAGSVEVYATFQGTTIARTDRANRIPYAFPYIYPPLPPPEGFVFPPGYRPPIPAPENFGRVTFRVEGGEIVGLELHSVTWAPVGLFPFMAEQGFLFPRLSFGPDGQFHFANPDACLAGTPPENCPNDQADPDGIWTEIDGTSANTYFHPHLDLVTDVMHAVPRERPAPGCLPEPVTAAALVAADGRLYQLGGRGGTGAGADDDPVGAVRVYDRESRTWRDGPALPTPVASAAAVARGSEVWVLGGWSGKGRKATEAVQVLEVGGDRWREGPALPEAVAEAAAAVVDGAIYLISGRVVASRNKWRVSEKTWILDRGADAWREGPKASLPTAGASAFAVEREIYVLGGRTDDGDVTRRSAILDVGAGKWALGPELAGPVYGAAAGRIGDRVFLVGGRSTVDGPSRNEVQELDLVENKVRWGLPPAAPVAEAGGAVLDGALYVTGGTIQVAGEAAATAVVQALEAVRGWSVCDQMPVFTAASVMNAAGVGLAPLPLAPGSMALLVGFNLGSDAGALTLTLGGQPAPILSLTPLPVAGERLVFLVPPGLDASGGAAELRLERRGLEPAPPVAIPVADAAPGIFQNAFGEVAEPAFLETLPALVTNADEEGPTLNFADQPAAPGSVIQIWTTGLGADPKPEGVDVRLGNVRRKAKVEAVVPAELPGLPPLPGVALVFARIPENFNELATNVPVTVEVDGRRSNRASVAIREEARRTDPPTGPVLGIGAVFGFPGLNLPLPQPPGGA